MNIMDLIHEHLLSHPDYERRFTVEQKGSGGNLWVASKEHDYFLNLNMDNWPNYPFVFAQIGYNDNSKYVYHYMDDMELSSGVPTFTIIGHRSLKDVESPDFIDRIEDTLVEFLDNCDEWTTRRMKREVLRAADRMTDEDV